MDKLKIDDFIREFSALTPEGKEFSEKDLDGVWSVIYFYPKDDTPGCTAQACSFRDDYELYHEKGVQIIGVSGDSAVSHEKFIQKFTLPFLLVTDAELKMAQAFGIVEERNWMGKLKRMLTRATFLIAPDRKVVWIEVPVKVEGHSKRVLEAFHNRSGS